MTNAADTDTAAVLNRWLTLVSHDSHTDPLTPALRLAEKEAEAALQQLEKDVRAYRKLSIADHSDEARRLRATLGPTTLHDASATAEHRALQALADPGSPDKALLLTALTHYYTAALRTTILSNDHPRVLANNALDRHRAALHAHGSQRKDLSAPPPKRRTAGRRSRPVTEKTLRQVHDQFIAALDEVLTKAVSVNHDTPNRKPADPLPAALKLRPEATFDSFTVHQAGCHNLPFLITGSEDALTEAITARAELRIPQITAACTERINRNADNMARAIAINYMDDYSEIDAVVSYAQKPLEALWARLDANEPMPPTWRLLFRDAKGRAARNAASAKALTHAQDREEKHEIHDLELSPYQQAERRASYAYNGPPLGWTADRLTATWQAAHPDRPMPRSWRAIATDAGPEMLESARSESYLLDTYHSACDSLRDHIRADASPATQRRRQAEAQECLDGYLATSAATAQLMEAQGIEPPPPDDHERLPPIQDDARPRGTPKTQQAMAMPEVTVIPRRLRAKTPGPAPRRPQQAPPAQTLQLALR